MTPYLGQAAALATSLVWSFTSIFFTLSGRQVGSVVVNRVRLLLALLFVSLMHWALMGHPVPVDAEPFRWGWLAFSGLLGFAIGDGFLLQAFVLIGPRLSMLLMSLAPVFSVLLGWVFLHEALDIRQIVGITMTLGGIALVVTGRQPEPGSGAALREQPRDYGRGLLFGLGGAMGQAGGLFASKLGLQGEFSALSGNLIRVIAATIAIWGVTLIGGQFRATVKTLQTHPRAIWPLIGGSIGGPFIGVWLSLIAVQNAPLGIASTLMSLPPVILLPIDRLFFRQKIGVRAIFGTIAAVAGTAILFLVP